MAPRIPNTPIVCLRCLRSARRALAHRRPLPDRAYSSTATPEAPTEQGLKPTTTPTQPKNDEPHAKGALHARLEQATEEALLTGGRAGARAIEEAGFSESLKSELYEKILAARYDPETSSPSTVGHISSAAGAGTRTHAESKPWTGEETQEDAALRMLDDAKRKLPIDLRTRPLTPPALGGRKVPGAKRAVGARERAGAYQEEKGLSEEEREKFRRELRERFMPGARALPNTISGLAALANERIEEAIAKGQFKNIPRGPGVERDTRADNPFIDTTEYIMNKMIKRQDLVPPWIDKQQEVAKAVSVFRARIRDDWRRHVARSIAERGGPLDSQIRTAEAYALAEAAQNPRRRDTDKISVPSSVTHDAVHKAPSTGASPQDNETGTEGHGVGAPFRDKAWEDKERKYIALAVENLNSMTRSYNLMAPELAKKPYFSLERELEACFADVAPLVAGELRERALARHAAPSFWGGLGGGAGEVRVMEMKGGEYGFKEMWKDLWGKKQKK